MSKRAPETSSMAWRSWYILLISGLVLVGAWLLIVRQLDRDALEKSTHLSVSDLRTVFAEAHDGAPRETGSCRFGQLDFPRCAPRDSGAEGLASLRPLPSLPLARSDQLDQRGAIRIVQPKRRKPTPAEVEAFRAVASQPSNVEGSSDVADGNEENNVDLEPNGGEVTTSNP